VKGLTLAWVYRLNTSRSGAIVGGEGPDTPPPGNPPAIKSTPLLINGVLYFSVPDHVWAVDARTGRELWHYAWRTRGGNHIGNRGVGILDKYFLLDRVTGEHLLTATHIDSLNNDGGGNFVAYDAATGKPLWHAGLGTSAAPGAGSGGRRGRFQTPSSPNVFLENFSASSAPSAFQIVSASSFRTPIRATNQPRTDARSSRYPPRPL
jgi:outer membrane protein assembly factor BamB